SPDGKLLAAGTPGSIRVWEPTTGREVADLSPGKVLVQALAFAPGGETLAAGTGEGVQLWDTGRKQLRTTLAGGPVVALAFGAGGKVLATAHEDRAVRLWDLSAAPAPAVRLTLRGHVAAVSAVAFSPDGRSLVTGGADRVVKSWDTDTGQVRAAFPPHSYPSHCLAF